MKKHHAGLLLLACLFLTCSELKRLEDRLSSQTDLRDDKPSGSVEPLTAFRTFPVSGKTRKNIISFFGDERDQGARKHEGVDIAAPKGTPVLSVSAGTVTRVVEKGNGGKQVWVQDRKRFSIFYYAHLDKQMVEEGQKVAEGEILGTVGNTGNAAKGTPHLHFEVHEYLGGAIDPLPLLPK